MVLIRSLQAPRPQHGPAWLHPRLAVPTQEDSGPHLGHLCGLCVTVTYGDVRVPEPLSSPDKPGPSAPRKEQAKTSMLPVLCLGLTLGTHVCTRVCTHTFTCRFTSLPAGFVVPRDGHPLGWGASSRTCVHCSAPLLEVHLYESQPGSEVFPR